MWKRSTMFLVGADGIGNLIEEFAWLVLHG
jgi:hypothetical protein